jgi:hypothetical protein
MRGMKERRGRKERRRGAEEGMERRKRLEVFRITVEAA